MVGVSMAGHIHPLGIVEPIGNELDEFAAEIRGELVLPDSDEYDDARNVWNGLINKYPGVVVRPHGASDVARAVQFAREHGLDISVKGGGHHQAGSAIADRGLVVDLSQLDEIHVDTQEQVARVGAGTRAEDLLAEVQEHGLAAPTGSAGDVGIPGATLGGGIGWIRRKHGLSIDALRSVEIVTADGRLRKASPEYNEDLFWAVCGGGGNFGIVTNFTFELYEVGPIVGALGVFYPFEVAEEVLEAHRKFMADAPDAVTTILLVGHVPGLPPVPEEIMGTDAVAILGCFTGPPEEGMEELAPLREIANPILDLSDPMPYEVLHDLGTQMFPWGRKYSWRSVYFDEMSAELEEIILDHVEEAPSELSSISVWPQGGAVGSGPDAAYPHDDKQYLVVVEGNWEDHDNVENMEWVRETERFLREAGGEGSYAGFTGVEEQEEEDWREKVYADSYNRLATVKAEYDPDNVFRHNVNIDPEDG